MRKKIFIKQWLELKPYEIQTLTDGYYIKLSNDIKSTLLDEGLFVLLRYLNDEEINLLCCFLVSYFEDIISETNIWTSFINIHNKLYKKKLPFYNTDTYFDGEINEQDISFLIWYFLNTIQGDKFISPFNNFIEDLASQVMLIFEKEYEYAPENKRLKTYYTIDKNEPDYYVVRNLIDIILFKTYLYFFDTSFKLKQQEQELIEKNNDDDENLLMILRDNRDSLVHKSCTRLLSLKGKEWASEILGAKHAVSVNLFNMSQRVVGYFFYKGQDKFDIFIEHIASGKRFNLTKKSYENCSDLQEIDSIIYMGIVRWKNEWWFSGVNFQIGFNADLVLKEKNSISSRKEVNFLDHDNEEVSTLLQKQSDAFLSFNNGNPIAFMPSDKIEDFYKNYMAFFNNSLKLSEEQKEQSRKSAKKEGFFGGEDKNTVDFTEASETGLVFFNPNSGLEIALDVNSAFPLNINPFYNVEESEDAIMHLLMLEELSTELAKYCIYNCKNDLPFFKENTGKKYLGDIDFLLRFWKKENYHSKPSITFTGRDEK